MTYHTGSTILVGVDGSPDACIAAAESIQQNHSWHARCVTSQREDPLQAKVLSVGLAGFEPATS
jgi:hypothetical protein